MKESFPAPKNTQELEASRKASDEKLKEGDQAYMVELPSGRRQLEVEESLIEELRAEMNKDLTEREVLRLAEESVKKSVAASVEKQRESFEKEFVSFGQSKIGFRLGRAILDRVTQQMDQVAAKHGLSYAERMDDLQNQKARYDSHNISDTSSADEVTNARRFLLTRLDKILASAKQEEKEHLFGSSPINMRELQDVISEIDRLRYLYPKFEVGKTGIHMFMDSLVPYLAALEFDKEHHPDEIHVMGTFDSAIQNAKEALDLLSTFQARLMVEKINVEKS